MRPSARKSGFTLGSLDERLCEYPFTTDFEGLEEEESMDVFRVKLMIWLKQMMYVSGETAEPSHETTGMVEEIVRQQVIEMVRDTESISSISILSNCSEQSSRMHKHLIYCNNHYKKIYANTR